MVVTGLVILNEGKDLLLSFANTMANPGAPPSRRRCFYRDSIFRNGVDRNRDRRVDFP
jgi:hypothetical protein